MSLTRLCAAVSLSLSFITTSAEGHEYWIDPEAFEVAPGEVVRADFRVGETFEGGALILNPDRLRVSGIASGANLAPLEGRLGDRPAIAQPAPEGLAILLATTKDDRLTYRDFADFEAFVQHKAAGWTIAEHRARGLPEAGFVEAYSRYAKSLVAVGAGEGADRSFGLETEIVALANPYTDDLSAGLGIEVLYRGAPRPSAQVEVFERSPGGAVRVFTLSTDEAGRATVPVQPGHRYMLDSVVLREPSDELAAATGAVWESLWANLTFAVPE